MKSYSDDELLEAVEKWRKTISEKLKNEEKRRRKKETIPVKNILKNIKKELKLQAKNTHSDWNVIWEKVVGKEIREFTRVKKWQNGFLQIIVENPTLRSELDAFYKDSLVESIREVLNDKQLLRGIKFISN